MLKLSEQTWDDVIDINLKGSFNTIKAVSRIMMKQRSGHIINISSILGVRGKTGQAAYSSSKAGLIGLTKAAAVELAPRGIQVNAVLPGYMLTDMGSAASEKAKEEALQDNLLKQYSDPAEVADFIYHLDGYEGRIRPGVQPRQPDNLTYFFRHELPAHERSRYSAGVHRPVACH